MLLKKNSIEINNAFDLAESLGLDRKIGKDLVELCRQNDIASLELFGSFSRREQVESSDIDFLVTLSKSKSLIYHIKIENYFEDLLGKKVDMVTERSLSPYISPMLRDEVMRIYCEG
ncbi:nucleotidyltransferase family protein [Methanolobus bombayensis]|uniref:nucleotidyltransferase family protein n=1 Tax=Methanolobus bombayensis TaxID=38023 RepID=UPI001AE33E17|nr:nucleotidyltransferase domain-containing protein [Methanolobus bombayensis]MBP1909431.1 putative nucleotidyltransferase [Methanolobus bombayensis]